MPTENLTSTTWASVTLVNDEIWQARGDGSILTTIETVAREDQGVELVPGAVRTFRAGVTVWYKPVIPTGVKRTITLVREVN